MCIAISRFMSVMRRNQKMRRKTNEQAHLGKMDRLVFEVSRVSLCLKPSISLLERQAHPLQEYTNLRLYSIQPYHKHPISHPVSCPPSYEIYEAPLLQPRYHFYPTLTAVKDIPNTNKASIGLTSISSPCNSVQNSNIALLTHHRLTPHTTIALFPHLSPNNLWNSGKLAV